MPFVHRALSSNQLSGTLPEALGSLLSLSALCVTRSREVLKATHSSLFIQSFASVHLGDATKDSQPTNGVPVCLMRADILTSTSSLVSRLELSAA